MKTETPSSDSILSRAAQHERALLEKLDAAREEAKRIVDAARDEARQAEQAAERNLNEELGRMRREAEAARQAEFESTIAAAESRLSGARDAAQARVDEMVRDVLRLFIPRSSAGDR